MRLFIRSGDRMNDYAKTAIEGTANRVARLILSPFPARLCSAAH